MDDNVEVGPSTDVMARNPNLQDLMRIMAWLYRAFTYMAGELM